MAVAVEGAAEQVRRAYDIKSADLRSTDKRDKWEYLAMKMLSDHYLLHQVDLWGKAVLNIGCAPHPIDEQMYVRKVSRWVAFDINPNVIKANRQICSEELHPNLFRKMEFEVGDATALKFPDSSFDVVIAMSSLEHIPAQGWRVAMKELARVLRPGGYAVVTMSNKLNLPYYLWSKKMQTKAACEFGFEECIYPWVMRSALCGVGLIPKKFASNFCLSTSIWMKWCNIPFIKWFGMRAGYLCQK